MPKPITLWARAARWWVSLTLNPPYDCQRLQRGAKHDPRAAGRPCRRHALCNARDRAGLSEPADPHHRADPARRADRPDRAHLWAEAHREYRRRRGGREPHRRRRADRRRARDQFAGRRLHRLCRLARLAGDPSASHQAVVRPGEGVRAGDLSRHHADAAGHASVGAGEIAEGADRAHQGQSRQVHLRVAGQRLVRPRHRRAVQAARRRRPRARALQGRGAGGARPRRRPRLADVRHRRVLAGTGDRRESCARSRSAPTRA